MTEAYRDYIQQDGPQEDGDEFRPFEDVDAADETDTSEDPWADVPETFTQQITALVDDHENVSLSFNEASRILARYRWAQQEIAAVQTEAGLRILELEAEIQRIRDRTAEIIKPAIRRIDYLDVFAKPALQAYAEETLAGKRTRSVKLLDGTLRFRKMPDRLDVTDEAAAIEWAEVHCNEALKLSIAKTPLKKHVQSTGEVPEGCEWVPGADTFTVEVE